MHFCISALVHLHSALHLYYCTCTCLFLSKNCVLEKKVFTYIFARSLKKVLVLFEVFVLIWFTSPLQLHDSYSTLGEHIAGKKRLWMMCVNLSVSGSFRPRYDVQSFPVCKQQDFYTIIIPHYFLHLWIFFGPAMNRWGLNRLALIDRWQWSRFYTVFILAFHTPILN